MLHHQLECANNLAEVYGLAVEPEMLNSESNLSPEKQQLLEDYATSMAYCREETLSLIVSLYLLLQHNHNNIALGRFTSNSNKTC